MGAPYVCINCRSRLFGLTRARYSSQWLQRATFISLASSQPRDAAIEDSNQSTSRDDGHRNKSGIPLRGSAEGDGATERKQPYDLEALFAHLSAGKPTAGRYSRHQRTSHAPNIAEGDHKFQPATSPQMEDIQTSVEIRAKKASYEGAKRTTSTYKSIIIDDAQVTNTVISLDDQLPMRQTSKNNNPSHHSNSIVQDRSNQNPQSGNRSIRIHRLPQKTPFRSPQQRVTNPESIEKQLGRALEQQDIRLIDRAWQQAQALYASSGNVSIPIDLYNLLIYTLSSMKRLEDAFSVLQFMKLNGILPTLITWTSLMKGCTKTHNPVLLEKVWAAMLAVNIQPDDVAWTIRIQGLLNSDRINEGLQCLNDMTTAWATALLSKAKGSGKDQIASIDFKSEESVPGFPKPTTGTLNAVITVLARKGKLNRFTEVFQWAKTYGILFDVITYNILIKSAIRRNQTHIAIEYLRTMEAENVKPDVITFTLVLDAVFRRRGGVSLSTEEQDSAITAILSDMDRHGLQPNVHSFATMIDGLLKHHNNLEAAQGILKHMECKGIHPSAHIYTSLIAYYFSQEPPDVNAVDALWNGIQTSNAAVDLIFYDRMVEGYAKADRAGSALNLLRIMARDGKTPGWVALTEVAKTLAYNEQWERLQELVSDVELEEGLAKHGVMGQGAGRAEHFWALVENYGIERRKKGLPSQRRTVRKEMEI